MQNCKLGYVDKPIDQPISKMSGFFNKDEVSETDTGNVLKESGSVT